MRIVSLLLFILSTALLFGQHEHHGSAKNGVLPVILSAEPQPLLSHAIRLNEALEFVGSPLPPMEAATLEALQSKSHDQEMVRNIQKILDPFCIAFVDINPESRVKVSPGPALPTLHQEGWTTFLVKVFNQANITAALEVESPHAAPVLHVSTSAHRMKAENMLTAGDLDNRFVELSIYAGRPVSNKLSGTKVQYFLLQMYTRAQGNREIKLGFNVGQGSQDIGFRNTIDLLFNIKKAVKVIFDVQDENSEAVMASFIVTDGTDRFLDYSGIDYRARRARSTHWMEGKPNLKVALPEQKKLVGIYPLPARRLASRDLYPDFFFQPQIYRTTGEFMYLPPGEYHISYGRGPEYLEKYKYVTIPADVDSITIDFALERWIHMAEQGWYSADHHIHAAGCSHYESPEEGVRPEDMWRQVVGEDLNMGNNLSWGPSWYHQKKYFTGENYKLSNAENIMRYDVEVSGFPSSHSGHIVLLNLREDDYPGTTHIEEWPSYTVPVLRWAKDQGGITGYAHSGWGLEPVEPTLELPNYVMPKMDGIGANEYIVTVTHNLVDFYSAGDTPWPAELNMWYHTLNAGFKVRLSGETDFPCISDEKVGRARIYAELSEGLDFESYMNALVEGRSYVSTGHAHLIDFSVDEIRLGRNESRLSIKSAKNVSINVKAAAYLTEQRDEIGQIIASLTPYQSPYWHIERSRIPNSRKVDVELIVNGEVVKKSPIPANGSWQSLDFEHQLEHSSWVAVRIPFSAHSNPIFVEIDEQPIRVKKSISWCRAAVDQCWSEKKDRIAADEQEAAREAYDHARKVYDNMLGK